MNSDIQRALQARIETFAADVTAILQSAVAEGVSDALGSVKAPPAARAVGKKSAKKAGASRASRPKGQKRDPREIAQLEKALLREIKREGGRRIEQIAESMNTSTKDLKVPMQHLLDNKNVKAKGVARATRYTAK